MERLMYNSIELITMSNIMSAFNNITAGGSSAQNNYHREHKCEKWMFQSIKKSSLTIKAKEDKFFREYITLWKKSAIPDKSRDSGLFDHNSDGE